MALSANEYARIASVGLADGPSEPSLSSAGDSGAAAARRGRALADRYRIERELGACGMATVYLAHDLKHDRDVALKVLHPDLAATIGPDRFLSEIRVTANLQHPNILGLFDSGVADGQALYVGKFNQGRKYGAARGATFRERGGARCSQSVVDSRDWRDSRHERLAPRATGAAVDGGLRALRRSPDVARVHRRTRSLRAWRRRWRLRCWSARSRTAMGRSPCSNSASLPLGLSAQSWRSQLSFTISDRFRGTVPSSTGCPSLYTT